MCMTKSSKFHLACLVPCAGLLGFKFYALLAGGSVALGALDAGRYNLPFTVAGWACIGLAAVIMWRREKLAIQESQTPPQRSFRR
jgi:hypothetical protein